jgi:hypothetical protein
VEIAVTPLQPFGIKDLWPLHCPLRPRYSAVTFTAFYGGSPRPSGNHVFGETPNTAGEDARAPQNPNSFAREDLWQI